MLRLLICGIIDYATWRGNTLAGMKCVAVCSSQCLVYGALDLNNQCDCVGFLVLEVLAVVAWFNQNSPSFKF